MAREFAGSLYRRARWRKCRAAFIADRFAVDGGMCQRCREDLGYIVHHTVWLTPDNIDDHDIVYNHELLEFVCQRCHNQIEKEGGRYCLFDAHGQPTLFEDKTGDDGG